MIRAASQGGQPRSISSSIACRSTLRVWISTIASRWVNPAPSSVAIRQAAKRPASPGSDLGLSDLARWLIGGELEPAGGFAGARTAGSCCFSRQRC